MQIQQRKGLGALEGAAISTQRREEDGTLHHSNGESADPVDQRIAQLKKELNEGISLAHDNGTMSDAGNPALASAVKELSSKQAELQKLEGQKAASQKPTGSTVMYGGAIENALQSIANGAKGLWDKAFGGSSKPQSTSVATTSANMDVIRKPTIVETIDYPGSPAKAKGADKASDDPVKIHIVSGDFGRDTTQWKEMADFRDKPHYNGNDNPAKVDLAGKYANRDMAWFGPNANFRVDGVFVGEKISGSRIQLSVLDSNGNAVGQLNMKHFKEINQAIYQGKGQIFSGGTYIGRTNGKVGVSEGPHLHTEVTNEWLDQGKTQGVKYTRDDIYKWMRGEN